MKEQDFIYVKYAKLLSLLTTPVSAKIIEVESNRFRYTLGNPDELITFTITELGDDLLRIEYKIQRRPFKIELDLSMTFSQTQCLTNPFSVNILVGLDLTQKLAGLKEKYS